MSSPVTEIAYMPLVAGTDLTTGDAKLIWDGMLKTIAAQPGCKSVYWGLQVENPDIAQLAIDWKSLEAHKTFERSETYPPFLAALKPILAGAPTIFHLTLSPPTPFSTPISAPTTECISLYFTSDHSTAAYDANWAAFVDTAGKVPSEAQGLAGGWGVEEHEYAKEGEQGGKKKFFGGFIGWPSVEAHMQFRKEEAFRGVVGHLRDGPVGIKVHHVHFRKF
ncbi:hypothetical protein K458DRAFT_416757 [Lentithecium fluviatile CBS 122367]|uniref:ABM domain-containing protein n=1 Tax=Lentithecium fluviatile CBS 122367 TaxID=1168545 RepID=A0A6G1J4R1_9PLEO|nr:hypothetical protein K458DRAFT_416757 [Lentithecium fluviatile CBS 122367]